MWRKLLGCAAVALVFALAILGGGTYWVYSNVQAVPEFYREAQIRRVDQAVQKQRAAVAETQALEVLSAVEAGDEWSFELTDDEANSWLETELPAKFPNLLPREVRDPRVRFSEGKIELGWRHMTPWGETVVSLDGNVSLTKDKRQVAAKIANIYAGGFALPRERVLAEVRQAAQTQQLAITWTEQDGCPIAMIPIHQFHDRGVPEDVTVENLEFIGERFRISGRSGVDK
jgi:hypothetical protein